MVIINTRTKILPIMQNRIAGILGKGKPGFRASLAGDPQACVGPVDILEPQLSNVTGAESEASQKKNNRPVPCSTGSGRITCPNHSLDVLGRYVPWQ
jgi:hypothetical protein